MNSINNLFNFDLNKSNGGISLIGTDEAGRGPGAGPVYAAAVYFNNINENIINLLSKINDSKQLNAKMREELFEIIIKNSIYSIKSSTVEDIEKYNILKASLTAMKMACEDVISQVKKQNILVIIDGNKLIPNFKYRQEFIVKGDGISASIAAASILAKVSRDRFMIELDKKFPEYNWKDNKGYLTKAHLTAIDKYGMTKWHRKKFLNNHFQKVEQISFDFIK